MSIDAVVPDVLKVTAPVFFAAGIVCSPNVGGSQSEIEQEAMRVSPRGIEKQAESSLNDMPCQ